MAIIPAAITGSAAAGEKVGVIALVALCAALLLARPSASPRLRAGLMAAVLLLAPVLLVIDIWHSSQLAHLRRHPALAAAALAAAAIVVVALASLMRARPQLLALLAFIALPFRVPIAAGGSTANLLVPLYVVIGAGTLAAAARMLSPRRRAAAERSEAHAQPQPGEHSGAGGLRWALTPRALEHALAAVLALYGLQAAYSADFAKALENVTFFYAPFALLFVLLREVRWTSALLRGCLGALGALGTIFALVGFVEYARGRLFLNPKLIAADQYEAFFRVNSVFFDPNIYGRFLALVMIALMAALFATRSRRLLLGFAVLLAILWGGLLTSFSETSMAALLLGLAILAAWRWDALTTALVTIASGILALAVVLLAPASAHFGLSGEGGSANNATSGRVSLITGGIDLFAQRPLYGYGSGSFEVAYKRHRKGDEASAVSASHTIPVTVAAEQGTIGLLAYLALIVIALIVLFQGAGRSPPRLAIAACFAALVLHTWAYADFLEDPTTWALLAIGLSLARRALAQRALATRPQGLAGVDGEQRQSAQGLGPQLAPQS
ncbi:MAG TPA: O-antigen ligase family protein [Solirubrobacteraceae bacterium]|nr:O-antigen ligase family protein [Solirubrobacteraceae bacterium]